MSISLLLSSSLPYPPPPLLRRGIRRSPTPLCAFLPPPRRVGLAAARGFCGGRWLFKTRRARAVSAGGVSGGGGDGGGDGGTGITAATAATVVLAVMNRVLSPMRNYPFFLAQVTTFGHGCCSGANGGSFLCDVKFFWPAVMMASSACQAGASIIKGKWPDIFVVYSFGSGFQALFVFLLLPFLSNLKGIPLAELPAYVNRGAACFLNIGGNLNDCHGAPLLPLSLLFITMNMAFNIYVLNLVKMSTALVASLTSTSAVPLSIYVLSLPLPYIPEGTRLSTSFLVGAAVLVLGLLLYNLPQKTADQVKTG